jgi:hypothetical protein
MCRYMKKIPDLFGTGIYLNVKAILVVCSELEIHCAVVIKHL